MIPEMVSLAGIISNKKELKMEEMITNEQKQLNYKILKSKLKKALENEFWLEAGMIEYAIIED